MDIKEIIEMPNHFSDDERKEIWDKVSKFNETLHRKIIYTAAALHGVEPDVMWRCDSNWQNAAARGMCFLALKKYFRWSYYEVGRQMNCIANSARVSAEKVRKDIETDTVTAQRWKELNDIINNGYGK